MKEIHHLLDEPAIAHLRIMTEFLTCLEVNQEQLAKRHLLHLGFSDGMLEQIKLLRELTSYVALVECFKKINEPTFAQLLGSAAQNAHDAHWVHRPWGHVALLLDGIIDPNESDPVRESVGPDFDGIIEKAKEDHANQRDELLGKLKKTVLEEGPDRLIIKKRLNALYDGLGDFSEEYFQKYQAIECSFKILKKQIDDESHPELKASKEARDQAEEQCARIQLQLSLQLINEGNANDTKNPAARSNSSQTELLQEVYKVDRDHANQCRDAYKTIKQSLSKQLDDLRRECVGIRNQWEKTLDRAIKKNDLITQASVAFKRDKKACELAKVAFEKAKKAYYVASERSRYSESKFRALASVYGVKTGLPERANPKKNQTGLWV